MHDRTDRDAAVRRVILAARQMPRATPKPGNPCTVHDFQLMAGDVWELDAALKALDRIDRDAR